MQNSIRITEMFVKSGFGQNDPLRILDPLDTEYHRLYNVLYIYLAMNIIGREPGTQFMLCFDAISECKICNLFV